MTKATAPDFEGNRDRAQNNTGLPVTRDQIVVWIDWRIDPHLVAIIVLQPAVETPFTRPDADPLLQHRRRDTMVGPGAMATLSGEHVSSDVRI